MANGTFDSLTPPPGRMRNLNIMNERLLLWFWRLLTMCPTLAGLQCTDGPSPAWAQLVPGICLHSTSSWGSWCCSRRTGCTRTSRPTWQQGSAHATCSTARHLCLTVTYQFLPVLHWLQVLLLPFFGLVLLLQVGLNRLVLCIEVTHVLENRTCHTSTSGYFKKPSSESSKTGDDVWTLNSFGKNTKWRMSVSNCHSDLQPTSKPKRLWTKSVLKILVVAPIWGRILTYRDQVLHHIHMWQRVNLGRLAGVGVNLI